MTTWFMKLRLAQKQEHFFTHWGLIKDLLREKGLFLFLDYDGTLTPIVETPERAVLAQDVRRTLEMLSQNPMCKVIVVSGRAISDIRKLVGLKKITYVGNHGFEISGPDVRFENTCFPKSKKIFQQLIRELEKRFRDLPGVILEDKGVTLSVHYRLVEAKRQPWFDKVFHKAVKLFVKSKEIRIRKGKKVYDIRPPVEWDKGKAVLWLLKKYRQALRNEEALAVYIGDDETDEDAFEALKDTAVTVRVGNVRGSKAKYYLDDTKQVGAWLEMIASLKRTSYGGA